MSGVVCDLIALALSFADSERSRQWFSFARALNLPANSSLPAVLERLTEFV